MANFFNTFDTNKKKDGFQFNPVDAIKQAGRGYRAAGRAIGNQAQKRIGQPVRQWANNAYNYTKPRTNAQFAGAPLNYLTSQVKKATNIPMGQQNRLASPLRTMGNFSSNYTQTFGTGMQNMASMTDGANWRNALKTTKGVSQMVAPFLPGTGQYFAGANAISSLDKPLGKNDTARRASAGFMRGVTQDDKVATNVQARNTNIKTPLGNIEFDPAMMAGEMVGYVRNPQNRLILKGTNKFIPTLTTAKDPIVRRAAEWFGRTFIRGGVEDVLLELGNMPENLNDNQKAQWLVKTFGWGGVAEIIGQGAFQGTDSLAKGGSKVLGKVFDTFKGSAKEATEQLKPRQLKGLIPQAPTPDKPLGGMYAYGKSRLIKPTEVQPRKANGQFDFKVELPQYVGDKIKKVTAKFRVDPKNPNRLIRLGENNQAMGAVAGIEPEFDEEGNFKGVKFNPAKAGLGIAAMGGIKAIDNVKVKTNRYKDTLNVNNPDDAEYIRRVFSDWQLEDFKKGNFGNRTKEQVEDILRSNLDFGTYKQPKLEYKPMAKGEINQVFHGTAIENLPGIKAKGLIPGNQAPNAKLGGGYGKAQSTISTSTDPNIAGKFTGSSKQGSVIRLDIADSSKIVKANIEDAIELEPHLKQLKKEGVDAVYIGGGEKELVVLNPKILTPQAKRVFDVYRSGGKVANMPEEAFGAVAGFEPVFDEDGNFVGVKYNPTKGMIGVAGLIGGQKALGGDVKFSSRLDQKPRFEIDDSGARLSPIRKNGFLESPVNQPGEYKLAEIIDHPLLFQQYPGLKDLKVKIQQVGDGVEAVGEAAYSPKYNSITIRSMPLNYESEFQSTLLHEIQHAIQEIEGFARGGSPEGNTTAIEIKMGRIKDLDEYRNWINKRNKLMRTDPKAAMELEKNPPPAVQEYRRLADERTANSGVNRYQRLSGELEARAVQRRMDMPASQRLRTDPYAAEAIATTGRTDPNDFITRFDGGVQANVDTSGGNFRFTGDYKRGDLAKLQKRLDEILGTDSFNHTGKWNATLPARETALKQLEYYANTGDKEAVKYLNEATDLINQIDNARDVKTGISQPTKGVPQDFTFNIGNNKKQTARVVDTPKGKRIKILGNKSSDFDGVKFEETEQEAAEAIAKEYFDTPTPKGFRRIGYEFNKILSPLKNTPEETKKVLVDWNNSLIESKKSANDIYTKLSQIEPEINIKGDSYEWLKTIEDETRIADLNPKERKYLQQVRKILDTKRQEGINAGLDVGYLDNYLNHVWVEHMNQIKDVMAKGTGKKPSFTKRRDIPTYEEGIEAGLTPRFNKPSQLVAHYEYQLKRAIANKKLTEMLIDSGRLLPESKAKEVGVHNWKKINSPFFPKSKRRISTNEIIIEDYVAPPDVARPLNNIFEDKTGNWFLRGGSWLSKKMQDVTLSGGIPFTPLNAFTIGNVIKDVTAGRIVSPVHAFGTALVPGGSSKYFKKNSGIIKKMSKDGIDIRTDLDYDSMSKKLSTIFKESKLAGTDELWNRAITDPTFKKFIPTLQINFYKDALKAAENSGLKGRAAEKSAAEATKKFYGITEEFTRNKNTEDALSTVLFAPQWREAMINFWKNNVKALDPRNIKDKSYRTNQVFIVGTIVTIGIYEALNRQLNDGRSMLDNKDGKELYLEIPRENGRSWFIPILPSVSTVPRRAVEITGNLVGGDIEGASERAGTFLSQPVALGSQLASNRTFYDQPIYSQDDSPLARVGKLGGYAAEQSLHPSMGEPLAVWQGRKTPTEAALGMLELPIYPSKSTDFARLNSKEMEKYEKLRAYSPEKAEEYRLEKMNESDYEVSDDAPTTKLGKAGLYASSAIANPIQTGEAVLNQEPIRKLRVPEGGALSFFGSTTVTERKKDVSDLDEGDKTTQVDHALPKWLGGRETESNYQILSNKDHVRKTAFEEELRYQYESGEISRREAIKQSKEFNKTLNPKDKPEGGVSDKIADAVDFKKENDIPLTDQELIFEYTKDLPEEPNANTSRYQAAKYEEKRFEAINEVLNDDDLTSDQKLLIGQSLGMNGEDLSYYQVAKENVDMRKMFVIDEVEQISARTKNREELLSWLVEQRKEINGKRVLTNPVIDELYDRKIITSAEKRQLKKLEIKDGQVAEVKTSGRGGGAKIKKINLKNINVPRVRVVDNKINFKPIRLSGVGESITSVDKITSRVKAPEMQWIRLGGRA